MYPQVLDAWEQVIRALGIKIREDVFLRGAELTL